MTKQRFVLTAAALSLGFAALSAFPASSSGDTQSGVGASTAKQVDCKDLKGSALATCLQQQKSTAHTPGRSEDSASRAGGRTPGSSEDSASRTGTPPGTFDLTPKGSPAAGGAPKGGGKK